MTQFKGAVPALSQALEKRGYTKLTQVQEAVLAPELRDADLLVSAQTGSGKTVAFGLSLAPTLLEGADHFSKAGAPLALVVAPTRELALQVKRELDWLYASAGARIASCVGGMDMRDERSTLARGTHIIVGTPGRLIDHIKRRSLDMQSLRAVVLDEADEMLNLGFRDELESILSAAPSERRTLMFSATVPRTIANLAKNYQRDAVRVNTADEKEQHLDIDYRALTVASHDKENAITNILRYYDAKNALVFCATRATVNRLHTRFNNRGFSVVALSGELSQSERTHALQAMRDGRARVCVATDVAARGIDLPNLELVIHADLPKNAESLLHRSGRTGRAGRKGVSALIVPHNARRRTERLLNTAKIKANWVEPPSAKDVQRRDDERLLTDPVLSEPLTEIETGLTQTLLANHSAEQIAAAFVRMHRAGKSAPEDLAPPPGRERSDGNKPRPPRKSKPRDDFDNGVWINLSVGHKTKAEARWLLPMLCKAGGLSKRDIGAIRIHDSNTHVELAPNCVDGFFEKVGPTGRLEKSISVNRIDGTPQAPRPGGKPTGDKKPYEKKPYAKKKPFIRKPKPDGEAAQTDKPSSPSVKKPYKPKFAKGGAKKRPDTREGETSYSKPPKRKKPKKPKKPKKSRPAQS